MLVRLVRRRSGTPKRLNASDLLPKTLNEFDFCSNSAFSDFLASPRVGFLASRLVGFLASWLVGFLASWLPPAIAHCGGTFKQ